MNIIKLIVTFGAFASLLGGCVKEPAHEEEQTLDWSRLSQVALKPVTISSAKTRAEGGTLMQVGETFRLYAINRTSKKIIDTRTYTITGTDGTPTMDTGQTEMFLPYGVIDIFLVGPVAQTINGNKLEIAAPTMVTPRRGVDLVASKTTVTIGSRNTSIIANALEHKMAKLEIEIDMQKDESGNKAIYYQPNFINQISSAVPQEEIATYYISISNMSEEGLFVFDDNGGKVTNTITNDYICRYTAGTVIDNLDTPMLQKVRRKDKGEAVSDNKVTGEKYNVIDYLIPIEKKIKPTLTTVFGYKFRNDMPVAAHLFSGSALTTLSGGESYKLIATPIPDIEMTCRIEMSKWDTGEDIQHEVEKKNNLHFWYSGEDAPIEIGGKMYWKDRSGNENHAQIFGSITYDPINKCYYATARNSYFKVPDLGEMSEYTLELTTQSAHYAENAVVKMGGDNGININLPLNDAIDWRSGDTNQIVRLGNGTQDRYIYEQISSYVFARKNGEPSSIIINGKRQVITLTHTTNMGALNGNQLWVGTFDPNKPDAAGIGKQRIYSIRMYKKYRNTDEDCKVFTKNHANVLSHLGINIPITEDGSNLDYIKDGLILDLRGATAPSGGVWPDQSRYSNSPQHGSTATHNTSSKFYKGLLTFPKSLGTYKEITMEVVVRSTEIDETKNYLLLQFKPNDSQPVVADQSLGRSGIAWCDYGNGSGYIFEAPYVGDNNLRVSIPGKSSDNILKYRPTTLSQLSCYRQGDKLYASQNGYWYSSHIGNAVPNTVNELKSGKLGGPSFEIYAVRIYNRALTPFERQHNYLVDKKLYNILPIQ